MRILLTNDDGMNAAQLIPLIKWCQKLGEVYAFVPKYEQSAKSHSIEIHEPFEAKQVEIADGIKIWAIASSPADCVRFATLGLNLKFDLAISGVNRGVNLGSDTMYSGTLSAMCEAVNQGIPSIALSTPFENYDNAIVELDHVFDYILNNKLLELNMLYNVNIPANPKGIKITHQGGKYFSDSYKLVDPDMYMAYGGPVWEDSSDDTIDTDAVMHGYISISPFTINRTNWDVFNKLNNK